MMPHSAWLVPDVLLGVDVQLPVPGQVTVQAAQVSDPTEPPSSGPLLEIELLVTSERIDVSLGTAVINAYYYLEQARDAVAADPASTGLSPRFALRVSTVYNWHPGSE